MPVKVTKIDRKKIEADLKKQFLQHLETQANQLSHAIVSLISNNECVHHADKPTEVKITVDKERMSIRLSIATCCREFAEKLRPMIEANAKTLDIDSENLNWVE